MGVVSGMTCFSFNVMGLVSGMTCFSFNVMGLVRVMTWFSLGFNGRQDRPVADARPHFRRDTPQMPPKAGPQHTLNWPVCSTKAAHTTN